MTDLELRNLINESLVEALMENNLDERGGSELLYHFTTINSIKSMILNNGKNGGYLTMSHPGKVDSHLLSREKTGGGGYTHYLSLTRSPNANWGYVKALDKTAFGRGNGKGNVSPNSSNKIGSARITFDGRALSAGRVIKAVDFFGPYKDSRGREHEYNTQTTSGKWGNGDPTRMSMLKQSEDRLFGYTYNFDGILNYVKRIDIYAKENTSSIADAKEVLEAAKGTPVEGKIHVYGDFKYYNRPDYEQIKHAAEKSGINQRDWRKEITDVLDKTPQRKKQDVPLIQASKLKNLAVFVWIVLFAEKYPNMLSINENVSTGSIKFNGLFKKKDVDAVIKELLTPIRDSDYNQKMFDMISKEYESLTNKDIATYCFQQNPKFDALKGISKALTASIYHIVQTKFNLDNYNKLFNRASKIMKALWPNDNVVKSAHKHKQEQDKAARERFAAKKLISAAGDSNKSVEKKPEKKVEKPVKKKPAKPAVIKTYEPDATPRRGRKPSNIMIPSLAFRVAGEIIVIKNVKNTLDAIEKLSNKKPGYDFWSKSKSIAARISQEKRKLSEPTLFSDQEINEMVEACMKRLLG